MAAFSQINQSQVLDTVETDQGPVILYKNFSWEYLGDEPVMLSMEDDSPGLMTNGWITRTGLRIQPDVPRFCQGHGTVSHFRRACVQDAGPGKVPQGIHVHP
ncbi:MAG: hypothetical protein MZV63_55680 [Marinilabiliales bacterium]|nr:hypothetical protein [Marinilabiliales bacterium]